MYLEQELESLKVVLDIKNKQLHQQEKKLMQMDKLVRWTKVMPGYKTHNASDIKRIMNVLCIILFIFFRLRKV